MAEIPLPDGRVALVDDADYEWLTQRKWKTNTGDHVIRSSWSATTQRYRTLQMHRLIMDAPPGVEVDHINGNRLDNRRCNLRLCTSSENKMNRDRRRGARSRYKGVYPKRARWGVRIGLNKRMYYLGVYATEEEAARVYDRKAREMFGEFAKLNFPDQPETL